MPSFPNPHQKIPRQGPPSARTTQVKPQQIYIPSQKDTPKLLWIVLAIIAVAAAGLVFWRVNLQNKLDEKEQQIVALLTSADQLIVGNHDDEAEVAAHQALALLPEDPRCLAMMERISTKRGMLKKLQTEAFEGALAAANQIAKSDIAAALDAFGEIAKDPTFTTEAKQIAAVQSRALNGTICSLRLPADWPMEAVVNIDGTDRTPKDLIIGGLTRGKHKLSITRYAFRKIPEMELEFRGLDPLRLPTIVWRPAGAKVFVTSVPPGAAVWKGETDTGKVTPCTLEDMDDGVLELVIKLANYEDTTVSGVIRERSPLKLTGKLTPK